MRTRAGSSQLTLTALPGIPLVEPGADLVASILAALGRAEITLQSGDVLAITSKIVSRSEGRFADLRAVEPSQRARELADLVGSDPRIVELVLRESESVSRVAPHALIVRHRLGIVLANAGIDRSNLGLPVASGEEPVLLLPVAPDESAERIRAGLLQATGVALGIVITDSLGRPFRMGTVGAAIGVAGMPALWDKRGDEDLFGRRLEHTITALADQVAAATDLVSGQADEGQPVVHVRGLVFPNTEGRASDLVRPRAQDLYA